MAAVVSFESHQKIPRAPGFEHLLPEKIFITDCTIKIEGVNNAVANGLRRTICSELPVKALFSDEITSTDEFVIPEMISKRLKMVPILQSTPIAAEFSLHAENNTGAPRYVLMGEIRGGKGDLPFEKQTPLLTLNPGRTISIKKIRIISEYGFMTDSGMMTVAARCVSKPIDVEPLNLETRKGVSSSVADPRKWCIKFCGHGTMPDNAIVIAACENIIERVVSVRERFVTMQSNGHEHALSIEGESDTIGNLFMRTVLDLHPTGVSILYDTDKFMRSCVIKILCDGDAATIMNNAADEIIEIYKTIAAGVKKLSK